MSGVVKGALSLVGTALSFLPGGQFIGPLLMLGGSVGLEFLMKKGGDKKRDPFSTQSPPTPFSQAVDQPVTPRVWIYGRAQTAGSRIYYEANSVKNCLYSALYLMNGPFDGTEYVLCDDEAATWSTTLTVSPSPPVNNLLAPSNGIKVQTSNPYVIIEVVNASLEGYMSYLLGTLQVSGSVGGSSVADANMAGFWTSNHLAKDMTMIYTYANFFWSTGASRQKIFPNNWPTYVFGIRGAQVYDPRLASQSLNEPSTGEWTIYNTTWEWSENPALIIADFVNRLIHSGQLALTGIDWASVAEAANDCDTLCPIQRNNFVAGISYEPFARLTAIVTLDSEPRRVLADMMAACDGAFGVDQWGRFIMWIGKWETPQVTFTDKDISGFDEEFGPAALTEQNSIRTTYTEPRQRYQPAEAPLYNDMVSQAQIGKRVGTYDLQYCPSPSQAWRMSRRHLLRQNRKRRLTLTLNVRAMLAIGQRVVGINAPTFGLSGTFRVLQLAPQGSLESWVADLIEVSPDIFNDPTSPFDTLATIPVVSELTPQIPSAPLVQIVVRPDGSKRVNLSPPLSHNIASFIPDLTVLLQDGTYTLQGRYSLDGGTTWVEVTTMISQFIIQTGTIASGSSFIAQLRYVSISGTIGTWSSSSTAVTI